MDQIKIGKFIADCRKRKNLTQMQLAEKLNITDRAISKWENGKGMPDSSIMLDLCNTLEITVNELLSGEVIDMIDYEKKSEEMLLEMSRKEELQNKKLMVYEFIIGGISLVSFFTIFLVSIFLIEDVIYQNIVIGIGTLVFLVGIFLALKIETETGYYECQECGHRYVPKFSKVFWARHIFITRRLRCPKCNKKSWNKKVMSK